MIDTRNTPHRSALRYAQRLSELSNIPRIRPSAGALTARELRREVLAILG
ncbi:hypothetical protein H7F51_01250 [Novosphingobium flavum]|uniref:Uncharacterized protein n=1 Tax=Novosphingobium flavum TaxID=1778672 RepID=A0A7X1KK45_9SPHN|nr:hypothetical protein [Novosphingobium flavum]MBC2664137.1 hypothetical protein [Novosphingobium flavum]